MNTATVLDEFTKQYIATALWSTNDETGGEPLDKNYGIEDIDPETLACMVADCQDFQAKYADLIRADLSQAGHDFWLTRNDHGAGFGDGDWEFSAILAWQPIEDVGKFLAKKAKAYGGYNLSVGDNQMIDGGLLY